MNKDKHRLLIVNIFVHNYVDNFEEQNLYSNNPQIYISKIQKQIAYYP